MKNLIINQPIRNMQINIYFLGLGDLTIMAITCHHGKISLRARVMGMTCHKCTKLLECP